MSINLKAKYADIILKPRITEKASLLVEKNVYAFEISPKANKNDVSKAIEVYYKVNPKKVRIVRNPAKNILVRGKKGIKAGVKKAYVYLKKGDKLE